MPDWKEVCPNCGTENQMHKDGISVNCGKVEGNCICRNCQTEFKALQEFWRWLGLDRDPSIESNSTST